MGKNVYLVGYEKDEIFNENGKTVSSPNIDGVVRVLKKVEDTVTSELVQGDDHFVLKGKYLDGSELVIKPIASLYGVKTDESFQYDYFEFDRPLDLDALDPDSFQVESVKEETV